MLWLSLRLALQGGREALVRLVVTTLAVMLGVVMLLFVLAEFHGFQISSQKQCWECTSKQQTSGPTNKQLLWLYRKDTYKGQGIKRLDIATLGSQAPILPGIARMPQAGEFYASPALSKLIQTAPHDELADRFPGKQVGIIGNEALTNPDALVIFVGRTDTDLAISPKAFKVTTIATSAKSQTSTSFLRFAFAIGGAGLLFPILILIGTATRLSAARREERYAALRLVGATPRQINVIASVDAMIAATFGAIAGVIIFILTRPAITDVALTGTRFFANDITPTILGYVVILLGVPLAATSAALLSLRRVRVSPLGVSRKVTPRGLSAWRILPLLLGIALFVGVTALTKSKDPTAPAAIPGFVLIMVGLIVGGPWLTMQATHLMAKLARSAPSLLAARRLADNPKAAFRSVSGLVLAVFVGTVISGITPAVLASQHAIKTDALSNVLATGFFGNSPECSGTCSMSIDPTEGLLWQDGNKLIAQLRAHPGVKVFPVYAIPESQTTKKAGPAQNVPSSFEVMSCESLAQLELLGKCQSGLKATSVFADNIIGDHSVHSIISTGDSPATDDFTGLSLRALFVKVNNDSSLEKVRTLLANNAKSPSSEVPQTFGEVRKDQVETSVTVQRLVFIAMALTLLIAGCSLAVAMGSSLVERRRPFTLLRLSGTPLSALYKVMLWESVIPLVVVTLVAAVTGFGLSALMIIALAPAGTPVVFPSLFYYLALVAGLIVSLLIVCATLPLIGRITKPDNARFE